jgi:hypothetical protein
MILHVAAMALAVIFATLILGASATFCLGIAGRECSVSERTDCWT